MSKRVTVYTIHNQRFFAGSNPRGIVSVFYSRKERDAARARAIEDARARNLTDPEDAFMPGKTSRSADFLWTLEQRGVLLANGIDLPQHSPDFAFGPIE